MRKRRGAWRPLLAAIAVALVAVIGLAPRPALAGEVSDVESLKSELVAEGSNIITLNANISGIDQTVEITGDKTIDLNGHTISGSVAATDSGAGNLFRVVSGASLIITDGTNTPGEVSNGAGRVVSVVDGASLTLNAGTLSAATSGQTVLISGDGAQFVMNGGTVENNATSGAEAVRGQWATITITGGTVKAPHGDPLVLFGTDGSLSGTGRLEGYYGVSLYNLVGNAVTNGSVANTDSSSFTMDGGTIECYVYAITGNNTQSARCYATINDGTITVDSEATAIYWPMEGNLTVHGGTISGGTAIEAKMGTVSITGGVLCGTGSYEFGYAKQSGTYPDGSAVKLVGQLYGGSAGQYIESANLTCTITGGTLESERGNAVSVYRDDTTVSYAGKDLTAVITVDNGVTIEVPDGRDPIRVSSVDSDFNVGADGGSVTTGQTTIRNEALADVAVISTGKTETGPNSSISTNTLYSSLAAALADADEESNEITLLRDVVEDVTIPEGANVTIDLGTHDLSGTITNGGTLQLTAAATNGGSLIGEVVGNDATSVGNVNVAVAKIGEQTYPTIADAIKVADPQDTIVLLASVHESIAIPAEKTVTLDLNGYALTNEDNKHTITNNGDLTIIDTSSNKTGTVDNISHQKAALFNNVGGIATLSGGTFNRSMENGSSAENSGGNSFYTLQNYGTMTVNDGVTVRQGSTSEVGKFSSLVENGWYDGTKNSTSAPAVMIVNGGSFVGGLNTIKNDDWGKLTINGGSFTNTAQAAVLNWNEATINGGTFQSEMYAVVNGKLDDSMDRGALSITGGNFTGGSSYKPVVQFSDSTPIGDVSISGGSFWAAPDASQLAPGFVLHQNADGSYGAVSADDILTVTVGGETYRVLRGQRLTAPADPTREGYVFAGWVDAKGKPFDFSKPVTADATLTASWELAKPVVTTSVSDESPIKGDTITISAKVDEAEGVTYAYAWYDGGEPIEGADGSSIEVTADGSYAVKVTATDADGLTSSTTTDPVEVTFGGITLYRLYNPYTGQHLYTSDPSERDNLARIGWSYEGVAWVAPTEGREVYRLYNRFSGDHHYTTSASERDGLVALGWSYEGVAWRTGDSGEPLYRLFNPYATVGTHHYTADISERNGLIKLGWQYEGVDWYGLK